MIAEVIVDIAASEVDRIFEYQSCGATLGSRVVVPFGAQKKEGFVIGLKETSEYPLEKIKPVSFVYDEPPAITNECLAVVEEIRRTCHVTWAAALRLFLPAEMRTGKVREKTERTVKVANVSPEEVTNALQGKKNERQFDLYRYLLAVGEQSLSELKKSFGGAVETLRKKGFIEVYEREVERSPYADVAIEKRAVQLTADQQAAVDRKARRTTHCRSTSGGGRRNQRFAYRTIIVWRNGKRKNRSILRTDSAHTFGGKNGNYACTRNRAYPANATSTARPFWGASRYFA